MKKYKIFQSTRASFVAVNESGQRPLSMMSFFWNKDTSQYEPNKFTDDFEHTGNDRCSQCKRKWTGF